MGSTFLILAVLCEVRCWTTYWKLPDSIAANARRWGFRVQLAGRQVCELLQPAVSVTVITATLLMAFFMVAPVVEAAHPPLQSSDYAYDANGRFDEGFLKVDGQDPTIRVPTSEHDRNGALSDWQSGELQPYDVSFLLRETHTLMATKAVPCASFRADTLVLMADGTKKPIGEIEVGDKVVATDPVTGKTSAREVTRLFTHIDDDLLDLVVLTADGVETIHTTDHHRFWNDTTKAWVEAKDLRGGERLLTADGDLVTIGELKRVPGAAPMLDLTIEYDHTFYVALSDTAVLVHNQTCPLNKFNQNWINADDLPALERSALGDTLGHIDAGTIPTGPAATKWNTPFRNNEGFLPGGQGATSPYSEFRVIPQGQSGGGVFRVVKNNATGETYYSWTHYGTAGGTPFVRIR